MFFNIFGKTPRTAVLDLFLKHPTTEFYMREVKMKTKLSIGSVFNTLKELEKNNIVLKERTGNQSFYRLNRTANEIKSLKRLHTISSEMITGVVESLRKMEARKIVLFGSAARGEDVEESDIDVLVIGDIRQNEASAVVKKIAEKYGKKLSIAIRTQEQYIDMPNTEKILWQQLENDRVILYEV